MGLIGSLGMIGMIGIIGGSIMEEGLVMDDSELRKVGLAKKITALCEAYLRETGEDSIDLQASTVESTVATDSYGKSCYGRILTVKIESWSSGDEDDD